MSEIDLHSIVWGSQTLRTETAQYRLDTIFNFFSYPRERSKTYFTTIAGNLAIWLANLSW